MALNSNFDLRMTRNKQRLGRRLFELEHLYARTNSEEHTKRK